MRVGAVSRSLRNCGLNRSLYFQLNKTLAIANKLGFVDFQRSKAMPVVFLSKLFLCLSEGGQVFGRGGYRAAGGLQVRAADCCSSAWGKAKILIKRNFQTQAFVLQISRYEKEGGREVSLVIDGMAVVFRYPLAFWDKDCLVCFSISREGNILLWLF